MKFLFLARFRACLPQQHNAGGAFGMKANTEDLLDAKEQDRRRKMEDEALAELEGGFL